MIEHHWRHHQHSHSIDGNIQFDGRKWGKSFRTRTFVCMWSEHLYWTQVNRKTKHLIILNRSSNGMGRSSIFCPNLKTPAFVLWRKNGTTTKKLYQSEWFTPMAKSSSSKWHFSFLSHLFFSYSLMARVVGFHQIKLSFIHRHLTNQPMDDEVDSSIHVRHFDTVSEQTHTHTHTKTLTIFGFGYWKVPHRKKMENQSLLTIWLPLTICPQFTNCTPNIWRKVYIYKVTVTNTYLINASVGNFNFNEM